MTIDASRIRKAKAELDRVADAELVPADGTEVLEGEVVDDYDEDDYIPHPVIMHASYMVAGIAVTVRKVRRARATSIHDRAISAALELGDLVSVKELLILRGDLQDKRHARRFDRIDLLAKAPKAAKVTGGGMLTVGLLLAIAEKDPTQIIAPVLWLAEAVHVIKVTVIVGWFPTLIAGVLAGGVALWRSGMRAAEAGEVAWLPHLAIEEDYEGEPITPSILVTAFRDLGVAPLRKSIEKMGDAGAAMLSPIVIAGCGVEVDVTVPSGTSTEDVQKRHRKLAENMGRHQHELFITVAKKARTVRLFIAESGALDEPVGASPLVTDPNMTADYYTGRAPWGDTLRGQGAGVNLFQQHGLITGKSNQGKTASLRGLILWLALDPTVEFRIADLKGVGDWSMFDGLATELIEGPTDEDCMAATHMVEEMVEEMNRRLTALKESDSTDGVTRAMASTPGSGFHPLVGVVDEAQKVFMCPVIGPDKRPYGGKKHTARFLKAIREIQNQGRVVNVTIWLGVQDPTDENLPKIVREPAHLRIALYLATESQAKMALGEAPVEQGAAPHRLRDGIDRGTVVAHGPGIEVPRGEPAITIRTYFIDGNDAAVIADRAKAKRARVATRAGRVEPEVQRNILADLEEVLRGHVDKVRCSLLPAWLEERAPGYKPYETLTGEQIAARLKDFGIRTTNPQNVLKLDPKDFREGYSKHVKSIRDGR